MAGGGCFAGATRTTPVADADPSPLPHPSATSREGTTLAHALAGAERQPWRSDAPDSSALGIGRAAGRAEVFTRPTRYRRLDGGQNDAA